MQNQEVTDDKRRSSVPPSFMVARRVGQTGRIGRKGAESRGNRDVEFGKWGRGGLVTAAGLIVGFALSWAATRVMSKLLCGVSATDPATFAGIAVLFIIVALAASCIPARRATRIDPMEALRVD